MLARCQKTNTKAADHGCLENLAHFELRFVKNLGTSGKYAFFMPSSSLLPDPLMLSKKGQKPKLKVQANKPHLQQKLSANPMIGTDFAFTRYNPQLAAVMASS